VLTAALRDLQWRKRRFVIAIVGTGLVFAMTLVLTGLANGFRVEAGRTVDTLGLDSYVNGSTTIPDRGSSRNVNVFGAPQKGPGMPEVLAGGAPKSPDEIAVSSTLGGGVGEDLLIGPRPMRIVGIVDDSTVLAGQANVFLTVQGAQQLLFSGQPLISSIGLQLGSLAALRRAVMVDPALAFGGP